MKTPMEISVGSAVHILVRNYRMHHLTKYDMDWDDDSRRNFRKQAMHLFNVILTKEFVPPVEIKNAATDIRDLLPDMNCFHSALHLLSRRLGYMDWRAVLEHLNSDGFVPNLNFGLVHQSALMQAEQDAKTLAAKAFTANAIAAKAARKQAAIERVARLKAEKEQRIRVEHAEVEHAKQERRIQHSRLTRKLVRPIVLPSFLMKETS